VDAVEYEHRNQNEDWARLLESGRRMKLLTQTKQAAAQAAACMHVSGQVIQGVALVVDE
jgi:hypothetical protein